MVMILQRPAEEEPGPEQGQGPGQEASTAPVRAGGTESYRGSHGFQVTRGRTQATAASTSRAPAARAVTAVNSVQRNTFLDIKKNRFDGALGTVRLRYSPASMTFQEVLEKDE